MAKKGGLGRGLEAILGDVELAYKAEISEGNSDIIKDIDLELITENPYQPRKNFDETALRELSESIKRHGLIQPIIVIEKDGGYMLIAGERRFRATKLLGESKIKAIVADIESQSLREIALIENIQREDLNPIELANSYKELIDEYKITQDGLANIIHKSRVQITNTMRLLSLSSATQEYIKEGKLTQGHAKVIVGLEPNDEKTAVDTIIGQRLSVRETENLVKNLKNKLPSKTVLKLDERYLERLVNLKEIFSKFDVPVKIKGNKITIPAGQYILYGNFEDGEYGLRVGYMEYKNDKFEVSDEPITFTLDGITAKLDGTYMEGESQDDLKLKMLGGYWSDDKSFFCGDVETLCSTVSTGIGTIEKTDNMQVVGETYFDLSGRKLSKAGKGLVIKSIKYADGTTKTVKYINK